MNTALRSPGGYGGNQSGCINNYATDRELSGIESCFDEPGKEFKIRIKVDTH